jgi:hypothetical protein
MEWVEAKPTMAFRAAGAIKFKFKLERVGWKKK